MNGTSRKNRRRFSGQNMVEFALIAPVFFMMLFGVIEMGRLLWTNHTMANATREGARLVMVSGSKSQFPASEDDIANRIAEKTTGVDDGAVSISVTGLGGEPGTNATVSTSYEFEFITGQLLGLDSVTLDHTSVVIIQH